VLDWKLEYILLIIENTTGMPHLGNGVCTLKDHDHVSLSNDVPYAVRPTLHSYIYPRGLVLGFISISHTLTVTVIIKFMEGFLVRIQQYCITLHFALQM
jgi:hypothetical protein